MCFEQSTIRSDSVAGIEDEDIPNHELRVLDETLFPATYDCHVKNFLLFIQFPELLVFLVVITST